MSKDISNQKKELNPGEADYATERTIVLSDEPSEDAQAEIKKTDQPLSEGFRSLLQKAKERFADLKTKGAPDARGTNVLAVQQYLVDEVEEAIRPHIRRGVSFSANQVILHVLETNAPDVQRILAAIEDVDPGLESAVINRLRSARIALPAEFSCDVIIYTSMPVDRPELFDESNLFVELREQTISHEATISVLEGAADQPAYVISSNRPTTIGRMKHIENERGHLIRTNVIAFIDPDMLQVDDPNKKINETVSRIHGRFEYDRDSKRFRYRNERGSTRLLRSQLQGPQIIQSGRSVPLETGDVLYLGSASVEFSITHQQ